MPMGVYFGSRQPYKSTNKMRAVCDVCHKEFASDNTAVSHYRSKHGGGASIHTHGGFGNPQSASECPSCSSGKTTIHSKGVKFPL